MPGETDLAVLLRTLKPVLHPATYVWLTVPGRGTRPQIPADQIMMSFFEPEGETLVVKREQAEALRLEYTYPSRMITLDVHSSLEAVGFMATISTRLARGGISVNPVSGYYHDHLFVKADEAERAVGLLEELARDA